MTIPIPEIRQYLTSAYSDDELGTLCSDFFRDVYEDFAAGMTKAQRIRLLLDYCQHRDQLPNLLAALKRDRPQQYRGRFAEDVVVARPVAPHLQRDPRQVFINHAHQDAEFAQRLAGDLRRNGWRVWIAPDSIRPGEKWVEAINRGLEESGVFVVALTSDAVASSWVTIETNSAIALAQGGEARFIPLFVSECRLPALWRAFQYIPFSGRYPAGLADLLGTLDQREIKPQEIVPTQPSVVTISGPQPQPEPTAPPKPDAQPAPTADAPSAPPIPLLAQEPMSEAVLEMPQMGHGVDLNPRYTFESFIVGPSNRMAHATALAVAERPGTAYNPLFLYGGSGLGKTHLLQAIGHSLQSSSKQVLYVTSEVFTNELIGAIRTRSTELFRAKYRNTDVLLLDDVHFLAGKEQTQEEFLHTFNELYASNRQIVLTSDRLPQAIPTLEDRLRSRFGWGMLVDVQVPTLEMRIAFLQIKAASMGCRVPDDVLHLIAQRAHRNFRDLEGALNKV